MCGLFKEHLLLRFISHRWQKYITVMPNFFCIYALKREFVMHFIPIEEDSKMRFFPFKSNSSKYYSYLCISDERN